MKSFLKFIKKIYKDILFSIAFYPVLISLVFFLLAVSALSVENLEIVTTVKKKVPYLFIEDYETAKTILSTLFGGILSLTVFSFTMVMVVLSQASSNFSPRLLPGLISNKKHQIILGVYIGTLTYVIIVLISLGAYGVDSKSLGLSTMVAAIFGVLCVGLFVYFIDNISRAVQIHNIIERIFKKSKKHLKDEYKEQQGSKTKTVKVDTENWNILQIDRSGFYRGFDASLLKESFKDKEHHIEILPYLNKYLWQGEPVIRIKEVMSDEDMKSLLFGLHISSDRHGDDNAIGGMIKLMEVAVKALSPGINDPGTAINVIAKIGQLMQKMLSFEPKTIKEVKDSKIILVKNHIPADELIRTIIQPIRHYSENDLAVQYELIGALKFVLDSPETVGKNKVSVRNELDFIKQRLKENINKKDREQLLPLFDK